MSLEDDDKKQNLGGKYAQVRQPVGVNYIRNADGSYTQDPSTYRATKQNIKRGVLPRRRSYETDVDWL
jgi:hypothetical protein